MRGGRDHDRTQMLRRAHVRAKVEAAVPTVAHGAAARQVLLMVVAPRAAPAPAPAAARARACDRGEQRHDVADVGGLRRERLGNQSHCHYF